jgi:DtxR family Mn-dependent transcriptional regulator
MTEKMILSESLEDYLETILELEKTNKVARAKDIAEKLGVQRGSVTGALKVLGEKKLINYEPYSFITLTKTGNRIAVKIKERHTVLKRFLEEVLQVDPITAESTACRMEHTIDDLSLDRLVCFIDYIYACPRTGEDWIQSFIKHCKSKKIDLSNCDHCLDSCCERLQSLSNNPPSS